MTLRRRHPGPGVDTGGSAGNRYDAAAAPASPGDEEIVSPFDRLLDPLTSVMP